jgi:hypothetical protein
MRKVVYNLFRENIWGHAKEKSRAGEDVDRGDARDGRRGIGIPANV